MRHHYACHPSRYGANFSAFPEAVFTIFARTLLFAVLIMLIVSPCLSYLLQEVPEASFQVVQFVLSLITQVPCYMTPFGVL